MSASLNCRAWNSASGLPSCRRSPDVALRLLQGCPCRTEGATGDSIQGPHRIDEPLAFRADAIGRGSAYLLEGDGAGRLGAPAHLQFVASVADACGIGWYQKAGDALGTIFSGAGHDDQHIGAAGAGDEAFATLQYIDVAIATGPGAQVGGVGAGIRFGQAVGGRQLARNHARQPGRLQCVVGKAGEYPAGPVVDGQVGGGGGATGGMRCQFAAGEGLGTVDSKRCSSVSSKSTGTTRAYRCCSTATERLGIGALGRLNRFSSG